MSVHQHNETPSGKPFFGASIAEAAIQINSVVAAIVTIIQSRAHYDPSPLSLRLVVDLLRTQRGGQESDQLPTRTFQRTKRPNPGNEWKGKAKQDGLYGLAVIGIALS